MSLQHQEDQIQRLIMSRESRNMQHFLLMNLRCDPSGVSHPHDCDIMKTIDTGNDEEFRSMFRVSRPVFSALVTELSQYLRNGRSRNRRQNVSAEMKLGIALYYMAHGGSGKHLSSASGLKKCTALKYLYQVSKLICTKLSPKFMGDAILNERNYMRDCRARFHARNGFPNVAGCVDGTHIPYKPNFGSWSLISRIISSGLHFYVLHLSTAFTCLFIWMLGGQADGTTKHVQKIANYGLKCTGTEINGWAEMELR